MLVKEIAKMLQTFGDRRFDVDGQLRRFASGEVSLRAAR
jgi:hypothetical protein